MSLATILHLVYLLCFMKESQWGNGVDFWFLVSEVALSIVEAMVC